MKQKTIDFTFQGIDGLDAFILFSLAAFLAALNAYLKLGLDPKTGGVIIGLSVVFLLEKRRKLFPKKTSNKIDPKRISVVGILGALFASGGFTFSLIGFQNLMNAGQAVQIQISENEIQQEVKKQIEFQALQKEIEVLASAKEVNSAKDISQPTEALNWDEVKETIKKEVKQDEQRLAKEIGEKMVSELQVSANQQKEVSLSWAKTLLPVGAILLFLAAYFERMITGGRRILFSSEIEKP